MANGTISGTKFCSYKLILNQNLVRHWYSQNPVFISGFIPGRSVVVTLLMQSVFTIPGSICQSCWSRKPNEAIIQSFLFLQRKISLRHMCGWPLYYFGLSIDHLPLSQYLHARRDFRSQPDHASVVYSSGNIY